MQLYSILYIVWQYISLTFMITIEIIILTYFMKQIVNNILKNKQKPIKKRNDIKYRLEKANRKFNKLFR